MIRTLAFFIIAANLPAEKTPIAEYNQAWLLQDNGSRREAIAAAENIVARDPAYYRAYYLIAEAAYEEKHPEDAESYFRQLAATNDSNPWPYYGLGRIEARQLNRLHARQHFGECVRRSAQAWPCYAELGWNSDSEQEMLRSLPRYAPPIGVLLARANFFNHARRLREEAQIAGQGMALAHRDGCPEIEAAFLQLAAAAVIASNRDPEKALPNLETAFAISTSLQDWESQEATALAIIEALRESKQFERAQYWIDRFKFSSGDHLGTFCKANLLNLSAEIAVSTGKTDEAIELSLEAAKLFESINIPVDAYLLRVGGLYARKGDFGLALQYMQRALALTKSDYQYPFVLRAIGSLYAEHGDISLALRYGQESVDKFHSLKMFWQEGAGRRNISRIYAGLGDFTPAEVLLNQALGSARRQNDAAEIQASLSDLGDLYLQMGRPAQALPLLQQAEALGDHTSYEDARIETLLNISGSYRAQGRLMPAATYAYKALSASRSSINRSLEAEALIELAAVNLAAGKTQLARQGFESALFLAERLSSPGEIAAAHRGLAELSVRGKRFSDAADHLKLAINYIEALRTSAPGHQLRASFLSQNWRVYEDLVYVLAATHRDREAFDYAERGRARAFLDVLTHSNFTSAANSPLNLSAIEQHAKYSNQILLNYLLGERESYLWVTSAAGTEMFRLPARQKIAGIVASYRQSISAADHSQDYKTLAHTLFEVLCAPAVNRIRSANRLVIVPDSELYYLPFEALIDHRGQFLVESYSVAYVPSASIFSLLQRDHPNDHRRELVAIGPSASGQTTPIIYQRTAFHFPPLPQATEELTQITAMFAPSRTKLLLGKEATLAALKEAKLADYKRIHFAGHTVFDERSPERTGIMLTASATDDGILRPRDILKLHLDADLVVLSACQTGLGKLVRGEGIAGLSQAFLYAGAQRVVVSTWEVNDLATSDLMIQFYLSLKHDLAPVDALRQAKLYLLHSGSPAYRHPYYWASFVSVGAL